MTEPKWGPTGQTVYERTYQRVKADGERETWEETCQRVARGNLELVYGPMADWPQNQQLEYAELWQSIYDFKIIPAGRHLWASGVKGRQYLFNCHVAGWGEKFSDHFRFTFLQLMQGGGVGANYSSRFLQPYGLPGQALKVHVVCDPSHADYEAMKAAGVLSDEFTAEWDGAFEVDDSREGWADALTDLIDTYWRDDVKHADRVYDVTNVRPAGARLKTFGGTASGPQPFARMMLDVGNVLNSSIDEFWQLTNPTDYVTPIMAMEIDHAIAACVVSGGVRRSARMSILEWNDPFIMEFINCKADTSMHWTTNISVAIDDEFLKAERQQGPDGNLAGYVHDAVVKGMLKNGEPGYWNRSLSQQGEVREVVATNPCGEITLEPWENCNLGHVNLSAFVDADGVDSDGIDRAHALMTRFLIRATFGDVSDEKQAATLTRNRRIGVGHLGVQGFIVKQGGKWSQAHEEGFGFILKQMKTAVRDEARAYAFELRIPEPVKVTTVAPTGSIAKLPGVSEGIHPIYARHFIRRVRFSEVDETQRAQVAEFKAQGFHVEPDMAAQNTVIVEFPTKDNLVAEVEALGFDASIVESADEISLADMLRFQAMYQQNYADNAVSFTVNVPDGKLSVNEVAETLVEWLPLLKGTTLMPDGTRPQAPYERITPEEYEAYAAKSVADGIDEDCTNGACPIR